MTSKKICDCVSLLQTHLCSIPVAAIRDALDLEDSAISRIKSGERRLSFEDYCRIIALPSTKHPHGLTLAPANTMIITRERLRALCVMARDAVNVMVGEEECHD